VTVYLVLGTLLVGLVYFALTAIGFGLLLSLAVGLLAFGFFRLVDPGERGRSGYLRVLTASGGGSALGLLASLLLGVTRTPAWDWAGVLLCVIVASASYSIWAHGTTPECTLCKASVHPAQAFTCPRCGDRVCAQPTCWNSRFARCTRCHEREIVAFPVADKWWDGRLGPRVLAGECSSCGREAQETDLRECGQCRWPMCKRCWDYFNGGCQRCDWVIPSLPPAMLPFVRQMRPRGAPRPGAPAGAPQARRPPSPKPGGRHRLPPPNGDGRRAPDG
jgi:hypothetical protein